MIGKAASGWQTTTADLALILFLVVSSAAADLGANRRGAGAVTPNPPPLTAADAPSLLHSPSAAVYQATADTTLTDWLDSQSHDERQVATVLVTRSGTGPSSAIAEGTAFLDEIEAAGLTGRLLVERGAADEVIVFLAYDRVPSSGMALADR